MRFCHYGSLRDALSRTDTQTDSRESFKLKDYVCGHVMCFLSLSEDLTTTLLIMLLTSRRIRLAVINSNPTFLNSRSSSLFPVFCVSRARPGVRTVNVTMALRAVIWTTLVFLCKQIVSQNPVRVKIQKLPGPSQSTRGCWQGLLFNSLQLFNKIFGFSIWFLAVLLCG